MATRARGGESGRHRDLKRRALLWAQVRGFSACAVEARVPRSGFRADVLACVPGRGGAPPENTAVFECKQARSDLLRDSAAERETLLRLREVAARREALERQLGLHLPTLRRGESLFPEYDAYEFDSIRHIGWHRVRREETHLLARLYTRLKLDRMRRYRAADLYYLVVCPKVIEPHEAPAGWGVLEAVEASGLITIRRPERLDSGPVARLAVLQVIAQAATRQVNVDHALTWEEIEAARQNVTG